MSTTREAAALKEFVDEHAFAQRRQDFIEFFGDVFKHDAGTVSCPLYDDFVRYDVNVHPATARTGLFLRRKQIEDRTEDKSRDQDVELVQGSMEAVVNGHQNALVLGGLEQRPSAGINRLWTPADDVHTDRALNNFIVLTNQVLEASDIEIYTYVPPRRAIT